MAFRARREWRPALIVVLLSLSVAAAVLLALQVHLAVAGHREATVGMLRDDASLAVEDFIHRACMQVGYQGIAQDMTRLAAGSPSLDTKIAGARLELAGAAIRLGGEELRGDRKSWMTRQRSAAVARGQAHGRAFAVLHTVLDGRPRSFAFLTEPIQEIANRRASIAGFELRLATLPSFFAKPLAGAPLLPVAKDKPEVGNAFVAVIVRDPWNAVVFQTRPPFPGGVTAHMPFGDTYEGVLAGYTADLSLDPRAAPRLVSGGLPASRLPFLLLLLGLSAGFTAAAVLQLRQERTFLRLREEFIASISHELRTPLTQIRMFAETLLFARTRSEAEEQRSIAIIDREARRLSHLVENVLVFSRASRGVLSLCPEERPMAPLFREVIESFYAVVEARKVRLRLDLDENAAGRVDADAVRHVLLNLLDNAVKYGPVGQEVTLGLERCRDVVRITVDDQGPGIAPPDRDRVFERFARLARDRESNVAGAGIGLAVVRDLVAEMGGRCGIEDREPAAPGARFVVELPAANASAPSRASSRTAPGRASSSRSAP
jgi:signal transduction histidine kinase